MYSRKKVSLKDSTSKGIFLDYQMNYEVEINVNKDCGTLFQYHMINAISLVPTQQVFRHCSIHTLCVLEVMPPQRTDLVLAAYIPNCKTYVFVFYSLYIETCNKYKKTKIQDTSTSRQLPIVIYK